MPAALALAVAALLAAAPREKDADLDFLDDPAPPPAAADADAARAAAARPFDADGVRAVVEAHQGELAACLEATLAPGQRKAGGEVRVAFTVARTGRVTEAAVKRSTFRDPRVDACVVRALRRWDFPRPERPAPVVFPFRIQLAQDGPEEPVVDPPGEDPPPASPPPAPPAR